MFVQIIFPSITGVPYTYLIPEDLESVIKIGIRVLAPVGNRNSVGFIVQINQISERKDLKKITDIIDSEPIFTKDLWELTKWIADYYYSDWGNTLRICFPKESRIKSIKVIKIKEGIGLKDALDKIKVRTSNRMRVLQNILTHKEIAFDKLGKISSVKNINSIINDFIKCGIISTSFKLSGGNIKYEKFLVLSDEFKDRELFKNKLNELEKKSPKQFELLLLLYSKQNFSDNPLSYSSLIKSKKSSPITIKALSEKAIIRIEMHELLRKSEFEFTEAAQEITLNNYQRTAVDEIIRHVESSVYSPFLLHGITGSGKTQVYIEAIKYAVEKGKDAIILVPEISLTPQLVHRFRRYFGDLVTIIHSRMSPGERFDSWRMIIEGKYKIVIGARSAIFAPLRNLGIIIVDEEHEPSFKQFDQSPRYNARDTAIMRARFAKAAIVLGSATPSIESYYNAESGKYKKLELPERVDTAQLPEIQIVDMKKEFKIRSSTGSISHLLKEKIKDRLNKKEGIILLQNHRGFSTYSKCLNCGYVETCENCNVTLTFHKTKNHLRCHYCGFIKPVAAICPKCYSNEIKYGGIGTQKVEEELTDLFPESEILRMDLDTTATRGSHTKILKQFGEGKADILLGTQMVAKGLDFSRVTLVGVILADTGMHFPDFRSNERTFQLLTQVSGKAGRSSLKGEVIIQTFLPEHYCFRYIQGQDYKDFYEYEIKERKNLLYPPFGRIILLEFKGEVENEVSQHANSFFNLLTTYYSYKLKKTGVTFCSILGPSAAMISKIKKQYRVQIIIKSDKKIDPSLNQTRSVLNSAKDQYNKKMKSSGVKYFIDIDPQGMM